MKSGTAKLDRGDKVALGMALVGAAMLAAVLAVYFGAVKIKHTRHAAACGLAADAAGIIAATGASEVHAACRVPVPGDPAFSDLDPPGGRLETSEDEVRAMVAAIS